jgi:TRAP-type C4-dicarboxylate transport system permease small subunit
VRSAEPAGDSATRRGSGWLNRLFALVEGVLAALLVLMLALVLGNVLLRYGFGTGIDVSEELARLLFIWVVFVGAVLAHRDRAHLNVDLLSEHLRPTGRWILAMLSEAVVVACCVLVVWGTAAQHDVISTTQSLVMGFPMSLLYGVAYVLGTGIGLISLARIVRLLREGRTSEQLAQRAASDEVAREVVA